MFHLCITRNNAAGYLFWRWLLYKNAELSAQLDKFFFGPSHGINDYDELAAKYRNSDPKPDKQFSILPTVLQMIGDCSGKTVVDVGCGSGFFTRPIAELGAARVYGIDNSVEQLKIALGTPSRETVQYVLRDIFIDSFPTHSADVSVVPFVLNYARTKAILRHLLKQLHGSTRDGGKSVFVIDLPNGRRLKRFGATKKLLGPRTDETIMKIELSNQEKVVCELSAVYYTPETIEGTLREVGFRNIQWHTPVISAEGMTKMGREFWEGYLDDPELAYLTAEK